MEFEGTYIDYQDLNTLEKIPMGCMRQSTLLVLFTPRTREVRWSLVHALEMNMSEVVYLREIVAVMC